MIKSTASLFDLTWRIWPPTFTFAGRPPQSPHQPPAQATFAALAVQRRFRDLCSYNVCALTPLSRIPHPSLALPFPLPRLLPVHLPRARGPHKRLPTHSVPAPLHPPPPPPHTLASTGRIHSMLGFIVAFRRVFINRLWTSSAALLLNASSSSSSCQMRMNAWLERSELHRHSLRLRAVLCCAVRSTCAPSFVCRPHTGMI
jgi:hypothetical protein